METFSSGSMQKFQCSRTLAPLDNKRKGGGCPIQCYTHECLPACVQATTCCISLDYIFYYKICKQECTKYFVLQVVCSPALTTELRPYSITLSRSQTWFPTCRRLAVSQIFLTADFSGLTTDFTDFMTGPFHLSIKHLVFRFSFLHQCFCFSSSVRHIKLTTRRLSGAQKTEIQFIVSHRIVTSAWPYRDLVCYSTG